LFAALALVACPRTKGAGKADAPPDPVLLESFDYAWARVAEVHPYPDMKGLDWDDVRARYRPRAEAARTVPEVRRVIMGMLGELGESHYAVFPATKPDVDEEEPAKRVKSAKGKKKRKDPAASSSTSGSTSTSTDEPPEAPSEAPSDEPEAARDDGEGDPEEAADEDEPPVSDAEVGVEVRLVDGTVVVSRVLPGSSAHEAGVQVGWRIAGIGAMRVAQLIDGMPDRMKESSGHSLFAAHLVATLLAGREGTTVDIEAGMGDDLQSLTLERRQVGVTAFFGNFPPISVRFEADTLAEGRVGYIGFSVFMPVVAMKFQEAMRAHRDAGTEALIIDLRGNPGGLAGMVMGLSGWLVADRGAALGVMKSRTTELRFVVNPRASKDRFDGPVVVLIDGLSASTSELFAAGLQELGRATVVGTTSAGMSLPSIIETLPNGDLLQFVTADLHTPAGVRIEGAGVTPDVVVPLTEASLLAGADPQLDAAVSHLLNALAPEPE